MGSDVHWLPARRLLKSGTYVEMDLALPMGLYWVRLMADVSELGRVGGFPTAGGYDLLQPAVGRPTYALFRQPQLRFGAPLTALTEALLTPRDRTTGLQCQTPHYRAVMRARLRALDELEMDRDAQDRMPLIAPLDPETGDPLPQGSNVSVDSRLLTVELLPAYIWAVLEMRHPERRRRAGDLELCYDRVEDFAADFIDDWLARALTPNLWTYADGSPLNLEALYRSLSPDDRADVAYALHLGCHAARQRLLKCNHQEMPAVPPPPPPPPPTIGVAVLHRVCTDDDLHQLPAPVRRLFASYRQQVGADRASLASFLRHLCERVEEGRLPI